MKAFPGSLRMRGIALIVLIASGCGLSYYQSRMDAQRARVQEFDEANHRLDDPIDVPKMQFETKDSGKKEKAAWPFEVFLRLPKGFSTAPKDKVPYSDPFPFYRYAGGSEGVTNIFVAAAWIADPKAKDDWDKFHPATFRVWVKTALQDYYLKTLKIPIVFPDKIELKNREVKVLTAYPNQALPATILYKSFAYTDEGSKFIEQEKYSVFEVYIREETGKQICIVVQRPMRPGNSEGLNKSIEASLGSMDISGDATNKRQQYKKAKG